MGPVTLTNDGVRLQLRVQPRSSRNRVVGLHGEAIKVQVTAPPVDGAANAAVGDVLSAWLGVPRSAITIVKGQGARNKVAEVAAADPDGLLRRTQDALHACVDNPRGRD
jgi:hypothetical protein